MTAAVVNLGKTRDYQTILDMCDVTEKLVQSRKDLTKEQKLDRLRRVKRTRARTLEAMDRIREGEQ